MWKLLLAFTLIPALELYLLIQLGQWMGAGATVALIVVTGTLGAWLAKREGLSVLKTIKEEASRGFPSGDRLVEGLMVLIGGALLLTPGVVTDLFGFSLIIPFTRRAAAPFIKRSLLSWVGFVPLKKEEARGPLGEEIEPEAKPANDAASKGFDHPSF